MMGLVYSSGDSSTLMSAMSANLQAAKGILDDTTAASNQLVDGVNGGQLSGKGYTAVGSLFEDVIKPCVTEAKVKLDEIQQDLDVYVAADPTVAKYGTLREDDLQVELDTVTQQRDETERQIAGNESTILRYSSMPGMESTVLSLEASNRQLGTALNEYERQINDVTDRRDALQAFSAQTVGLFANSLTDFALALGDVFSLLADLNTPFGGFNVAVAGRTGSDITDILKSLAGRKLSYNADGYVLLGGKTAYKPQTSHFTVLGDSLVPGARTALETYKQPIKAAGQAAVGTLTDTYNDFNWKGASNLAKAGKFAGAAGTVLMVGSNAAEYFHDGVQGNDVRDFSVDTAVDVGSAVGAMAAGAAIGTAIFPGAGTIAGLAIGAFINFAISTPLPFLGDKSLVDGAKDLIKDGLDKLGKLFW